MHMYMHMHTHTHTHTHTEHTHVCNTCAVIICILSPKSAEEGRTAGGTNGHRRGEGGRENRQEKDYKICLSRPMRAISKERNLSGMVQV